VNGRHYYGAATDINKFINAPKADVPGLLATGKWRVILPPTETTIIPETVAEETAEAFPPIFAGIVPDPALQAEKPSARRKRK
jgi:hypothetical protein